MKLETGLALRRALVGFPCGVALVFLVPIFWGLMSGGEMHLVTRALLLDRGTQAGAALVQYLNAGIWGAVVGFTSVFLRMEGNFFWNSGCHFLANAAIFMETAWCCGWIRRWDGLFLAAGVFTLLYLAAWAVRCIAWRADVAAIREKMGLARPPAPPSPLKWRESLPYLVLLAALYLLPRPLLAPFDAGDVPVLTALFLPWLFYPFAGVLAGLGAGARWGACPLLPPAALLAFLPNLLYFSPAYTWGQALAYAALVLGANLLGALLRRIRGAKRARP